MLWIAIHLPALPVQVFCRAEPERTPRVVVATAARRTVLAANAAALEGGIAPGDSLARALALIPQAVAHERMLSAERALLDELAGWALQFTPQVSIEPERGVLLEVAGSLNLFHGIDALLARICEGTELLGLHATIACAPTPLGAMWLARCGAPIVCRDEAALPTALAPLPLSNLIDQAATRKLFAGLGLHTLGECYRLPRAGLAQRGQQAFLAQLDRALGRIADPRPAFEPPPAFHARIELPCEMVRADALLFGCRRLLSSLAGTLAARQCAIERFSLQLEHDDSPPTRFDIHLGTASRDEARFALLIGEHLSSHPLPAPAVAITLEADQWLTPTSGTQSLFEDDTHTGEARAVLIARLIARLGQDAVSQLDTRADHRPERSTARVSPDAGSTPAARHEVPPQRPQRPLWLLDEPAIVREPQRLTRISGPERIEAGWWEGRSDAQVARDYYIARDANGAVLWVFQELRAPHAWFVHGLFS